MDLTSLFFLGSLPAYLIALIIYRLIFHPLRKFPGPKIAAVTEYYRGYYELVCGGEWVEHLQKLHQQYGPVVRVTPYELHFSDPDAYDDIHSVSKSAKDHRFYGRLGATPEAVVRVCDPKEASRRRVRLGQYFSRKAVSELESVVQRTVTNLVAKLGEYTSNQEPADLFLAYRSTTFDIITSYLFAQNYNALEVPKFQHPMLVAMDEALKAMWVLKYIPIPIDKLPERVLRALLPAMIPVFDQDHFIEKQIDKISANPRSAVDNVGHNRAIFTTFLNTNKEENPWLVPRSQLVDECSSLQFAGSDTVGNACMVGTYHLLTNPDVLEKLKKELNDAWPAGEASLGYEALEKLPYLTAVIKESLRFSANVSSALARLVGPTGAIINGHSVPAGTSVSCASYFVHTNPEIFPEPMRFNPERWLQPESSRNLEKYLVAFGKGPRICIGINLAWCELYLIFANVFRKLELEAYEPSDKTLQFKDFFLPVYSEHHLQALIKQRRSD